MGSVATLRPGSTNLEVLIFHLETAEKNYKLEMERRLNEIEDAIKKIIQRDPRRFPSVIIAKHSNEDEIMLAVDHGRIYFSEDKGMLYFVSAPENIFDFKSLIPLNKVSNRGEILRDPRFIRILSEKTNSG